MMVYVGFQLIRLTTMNLPKKKKKRSVQARLRMPMMTKPEKEALGGNLQIDTVYIDESR